MTSEESKCPVLGGPQRHTAVGTTSNQHWWPNQLNLKDAVASETEHTDMYPGMAKTAREAGFEEISDWFETLAKTEKSRAGRFMKMLASIS